VKDHSIHILPDTDCSLKIVRISNEEYFKIPNVDRMPTFFMSIVSDSNHWMFIASNGGLTAGRTNAEHALFPYYTDDKIIDSTEHVGSKTIIQNDSKENPYSWEPFSIRNQIFDIERNLYKHRLGNSIIFEEINHDLNLTFSYQWSMSDKYGFVKTSTLKNNSIGDQHIRILDGLQNVMPADIGSELQNAFSNLVNAYKYSELHEESRLGIFSLSARITDRAEPSEALFANTIWSVGLENPVILLSSKQVDSFRKGKPIDTEQEIKGDRGAYFVSAKMLIPPQESAEWKCIANVHQSQSQTIELIDDIVRNPDLDTILVDDIKKGSTELLDKVMSIDGIHVTDDPLIDSRHYSNTLFNGMRGGIFPKNYIIHKKDFLTYIEHGNISAFENVKEHLTELPMEFNLNELSAWIGKINDISFTRLSLEYLPLTFSRRHGDPSRPWNRFSINTKNSDGSLKLDYQGNWRDIFQNWEALAYSYPLFIEGMIRKFLNASTFDGYNPYRVLKNGFDWETIEPHNPWSYIGYWGDHQIIYLLKLLEVLRDTQPIKLNDLLESDAFAFAHIPYIIKSYDEIVSNPKSTIDFDHELQERITKDMDMIGSDGALVKNTKGDIHHVHFIEKLLSTVLARLTNYVPDGGIWMNTQRPEWNDANNALVGNGLSMVTLYYLYRFVLFFQDIINKSTSTSFLISEELHEYFTSMFNVFCKYLDAVNDINDNKRKSIMDELGDLGSSYRKRIYHESFSGNKRTLSRQEISTFLDTILVHLQASIANNKRQDGLYHAYNILTLTSDDAIISHLPEMLEGQVAAISSGYVSPEEAIYILDSMRKGNLYREDQNSYMLYPIKKVPKFLEKNIIPIVKVESSTLLMTLLKDENQDIIQKDIHGNYHFRGDLTNVREFHTALHVLDPIYHELVKAELKSLTILYESVFNHKEFTGRSGTFFAYEGIGSIYWHMVSKLRYAVQEIYIKSILDKCDDEIIERIMNHYTQITDGIGVHKSPKNYGAFPTDPYSHTPYGKGVQQPGMTGQVKEDVICRMREMGVSYTDGKIRFIPHLMSKKKFYMTEKTIHFRNVLGQIQEMQIPRNSMIISICQTPIIITLAEKNEITVYKQDMIIETTPSLELSSADSMSIFSRNGMIQQVHVVYNAYELHI